MIKAIFNALSMRTSNSPVFLLHTIAKSLESFTGHCTSLWLYELISLLLFSITQDEREAKYLLSCQGLFFLGTFSEPSQAFFMGKGFGELLIEALGPVVAQWLKMLYLSTCMLVGWWFET